VFTAHDGESALELVAMLSDVDILITNTRLGLINGYDLRRRVS
jgi:CheY-like chemotaxis protein